MTRTTLRKVGSGRSRGKRRQVMTRISFCKQKETGTRHWITLLSNCGRQPDDREFEPTPQECLSNFKKARKLPSENYVQFASRLSAHFDYYCQLRKVNEFRSLGDLIISDKIFETLDRDTMNHIATKQRETYFKPQQLGRECDVYLSARGKVSNDLMSRNPGSGVKTDGRNRGQTVNTWWQKRNSSNVF
ncbi:integrase catalytic domain-containing protein [Trichonephila clavipes]|uniref:Integrase catalytic domain-containing protein n=1 Tax=Trichonephila clavipes TaxID=2585209 RepID=A0A8X6WAM8_TRICX|nr:integrase catalytic domain-containing protein [Trichonephila clavipes]